MNPAFFSSPVIGFAPPKVARPRQDASQGGENAEECGNRRRHGSCDCVGPRAGALSDAGNASSNLAGVTKKPRDSDFRRSPLVRCGKCVSPGCALDLAPVHVRNAFGVLLNRLNPASSEVSFGKHQVRLANEFRADECCVAWLETENVSDRADFSATQVFEQLSHWIPVFVLELTLRVADPLLTLGASSFNRAETGSAPVGWQKITASILESAQVPRVGVAAASRRRPPFFSGSVHNHRPPARKKRGAGCDRAISRRAATPSPATDVRRWFGAE